MCVLKYCGTPPTGEASKGIGANLNCLHADLTACLGWWMDVPLLFYGSRWMGPQSSWTPENLDDRSIIFSVHSSKGVLCPFSESTSQSPTRWYFHSYSPVPPLTWRYWRQIALWRCPGHGRRPHCWKLCREPVWPLSHWSWPSLPDIGQEVQVIAFCREPSTTKG